MAVRAFPNDGEKFASKYRLLSTLKLSENLVIFHAIEIAFDRDVTLKVIRDTGDDDAFASFQKKAQTFSKLKTPFTASLFSFGRTEGFLYLVLEFVEGEDLRSFQLPNPAATVDQVINIFRQALFSLREAHRQGIIHGDLQLKNIMLVPTDEEDLSIKIRDFQIVNFSKAQPLIEHNEQTDINALGHILFALLAGYQEIIPNIQSLHAPIPLKRIISKMLNEENGYENVDEVLAVLGSPTLLDSIAPKTISTKKIYAIGLAFGVFIFAPLSWTSIQLLSNPISEASMGNPKVPKSLTNPLMIQTMTIQTKKETQPKDDVFVKASGSINQALPLVKNPEPILVKKNTIFKKQKSTIRKTKQVSPVVVGVKDIKNEKTELILGTIVETQGEDLIERPKFNPLKFSARRSLSTPKVTKMKVEKKKPVIKQASTKVPPKKSGPTKTVPISF